MRSIHQVLVGAAPGDAITQMALRLRDGLRSRGPSEIFSLGIDAGTDSRIRPLGALPHGDHQSVLVYHASYGVPEITSLLARRRERIVVVYHNVTPSRYFIEHDPRFASGLEWGRTELEYLRPHVALALAVSEYNADDLRALGYEDVHVIPAGLDPHRVSAQPSDPTFARQLSAGFPDGFVLSVSQLLPHKRQDVLIGAVHLLQYVHRLDVGLALIGTNRVRGMDDALRGLARRLRLQHFWLVGRATDRQLATAYRAASVFASASEHEGIGIPPLEAMAFGVPVVARGAAAVPETIGDAGIALPDDAGPEMFAEAIARVLTDGRVAQTLMHRGYRRVAELAVEDSVASFLDMVRTVA